MTGPVRRLRLRAVLTGVVTAAASAGLALTGGGTAHAATALPSHIAAPYFEAYNGDSLSGLASASGNKYLTMAFIQTPSVGSCTPYWNGDSSMPISQANFGGDIDTIEVAAGTSSRRSAATRPTTAAPRSPTAAPMSARSPPRTRRSSPPTTSAGSTWTSRTTR